MACLIILQNLNELWFEIFMIFIKIFIDFILVSFYFLLFSLINGTMKIVKNRKKIDHIQLIKTNKNGYSKPRFIQIKDNNRRNLFSNYANSKTSYARSNFNCWILACVTCFQVCVIWKQVTPINYAGEFLEPNLPA